MSIRSEIFMKRYRIQLPATSHHDLSQSEAFFYLADEKGNREKIPFHHYGRIYESPGLYEQIFYDRLRCSSPKVVTELLHKAVEGERGNFTELRVLDFGAGNGLMGSALNKYGVARLVGADIEPNAKKAADRDRPGIYDDYFVGDFTQLGKVELEQLNSWSFNCLTTVAALGFGDIPVRAFFQALNLIKEGGWLAFNIKESFMKPTDKTGFSTFIRNLMLSEYMDIHLIERYKHRLSMEGEPLYYYAVIAKKRKHLPADML